MFPTLLSREILDRIDGWSRLKQWERRELGQELRRLGLSYREIGAMIPVHKGTLSGWCADLELTQEQQERLNAKRPRIAAQSRNGFERRRRATQARALVRTQALSEAQQFLGDPTWIAGIVAYWSEGGKTEQVRFANSDPDLVLLFIDWSKQYLELTTDRFLVALHLHAGQDESERKDYWSWRTGIPLAQFRKTFVKPEGSGHRKNRLYAGTASIRVTRSGLLLQRVLGWIDALRTGQSHLEYTAPGR